MKLKILVTCGALAFASALTFLTGGATAATVTDLVTFSATDFTCVASCPTPVDPVTGSFTITFDPTQTYTDETAGISLNSLGIALDSSLAFDYSPTSMGAVTGASADELVVGGLADTVNKIQIEPSTNDFLPAYKQFHDYSCVWSARVYSN
jgi:hypothetical protein